MIEDLYDRLSNFLNKNITSLIPYLRRFVRFLALPYCYAYMVNWDECPVSKLQVARDLLYIFFRLKYFPDNYSPCRLWGIDRNKWCHYYGSIYDPYQRARLRKEVHPKELIVLFEHKDVCYKLCKAEHFPLPRQFGIISPGDNFFEIFRDIFSDHPEKKLIIKPIYGSGGDGIKLVFMEKNEIFLKDGGKIFPISQLTLSTSNVIQEFILQHEKLSQMSPSTNTCRIVTLLTKDNEALILGGYMRFGLEGSFVDNMCQGGVGVGININKGILKKYAYSLNNKMHLVHQTSGLPFEDFEIPFWPEIVKLVNRLQNSFPYFKMLGHDIAIGPNGPVIIEINAEPDFVALEQTYGPILADEAIVKEFKRYDLLINNLITLK